ncbi:DNA-binding protein [Salmonella enterica subsp. enterica serovar Newport]|uniref:DNA-binding protein n=1 Tax=Salmonella diarizonae TaxID=59204 RepID=A0A6Y5LF17_SALDZ|nr:DNA-binding protein [Salmonella enterica]EAW1623151.1 DNA-binding protein [Salmonella enterica subsp. diarizonae]EBW3412612.1 DNA-binding protein [Salmonella enterica subsp. enterica serovar Newport]EAO1751625.1 DNA-binding protein [Salmonella enterica]EBG6881471.1 DNA-binding protein [Salmonella enterica]EBH2783427.1 DNA-binding protein [Salmonella enterica]
MNKWKRAEILIVRQCAGTIRVADVGRLIGRTDGAVRAKARELHISLRLRGDYHQSVKYPGCNVEMARELHNKGARRRDIAEMLGMPLGMVNQYVYFDRRVG